MADASRNQQVKSLLIDALERSPMEREAFVCAEAADPSIRMEVFGLIDAHEQAGEFMSDPASGFPNGAFTRTAATAEEAGSRIDRYQLKSMIGEGGFGCVYLAEQNTPVVRQVALKIIKLGMDTRQVIARFEAERQALAMMEHPGIARVIDGGATATGRPYFVMELVRGVPITQYCDEHGLSIARRLDLFIQMCGAVHHAHMKGVIHRDLKPSNVLVTQHEGEPLPKVIDFGIAKATAARLTDQTIVTEARQLIGTPEYMSPEQADIHAVDIDTRADVYSLGVLLYELLTGMTPFDGIRLRSSTFGEMQRIIREEEPLKPSASIARHRSTSEVAARRTCEPRRLIVQLRGDLDWIVLKAIEKSRDRRYGSAMELADDLNRHLRHEPVLASPPRAGYRVRKFIRRHRVGVAATALIALAVIGGAIGTTIGMVRARESAERAQVSADEALQINQFMRDVLTSVDPDRGMGADVRLVEILRGASATASQRFADHGKVEAQVHELLGRVYDKLSLFAESSAEYARAMALFETVLGPDDVLSLECRQHFCQARLAGGHLSGMPQALDDLASRIERVLGRTHRLWFAAEYLRLLRLSTSREQPDQEEALRQLSQQAQAAGVDEEIQIGIMRGLSKVLWRKLVRTSGPEREELSARLGPVARQLAECSARFYGPTAIMALEDHVALAIVLAEMGDYDAAADMSRKVLDTSRDRLGECHSIRMDAMAALSAALNQQGHFDQAAVLELQLIECKRHEVPILLVAALTDALPILDSGGRWAEGERCAREVAELLGTMGGGHGPMVLDAELAIARFISLQGRIDEANQLFQTLLTREKEATADSHVLARMHLFYGAHQAKRGQYESAEEHLQAAAVAIGDIRNGTWHSMPDDVIVEFIALYRAWGKPDKVAEYERLQVEALNSSWIPENAAH